MTLQGRPSMTPLAADILTFWFGPPDDPDPAATQRRWFTKSDAFDAEVRERFGPAIEDGIAGRHAGWIDAASHGWADPAAGLALVLLTDQLPRNAFRGTARAFAGDAQALVAAQQLVTSGAHRQLATHQRAFIYLPFEHAEDLAHQRTAVQLLEQLGRDDAQQAHYAPWAHKHLDVIARFGRFPHRNAALGRASTPEELAFLARPGSSF
jgi:uncharacterized protein (DUF924 family)